MAASAAGQKPPAFGISQVQAGTSVSESAPADIKHAWYNNLSPFIHYRTNPVFMVPAHLTLTQLSKIMLDSNVSFKARAIQNATQSDTLETMYSQMLANNVLRESANGIIDLEYDIN